MKFFEERVSIRSPFPSTELGTFSQEEDRRTLLVLSEIEEACPE
jgi:hypothetical protein